MCFGVGAAMLRQGGCGGWSGGGESREGGVPPACPTPRCGAGRRWPGGGLAGEHGNPWKAPARKLSLEGIFHWCQQARAGLGGDSRGGCVSASKGGVGTCEGRGVEGTAAGKGGAQGRHLPGFPGVCVCVRGSCTSAVPPDVRLQGTKTSAMPRPCASVCVSVQGTATVSPGLCKAGGGTSAVPQMCACTRKGQLCTQNTCDGVPRDPPHTHVGGFRATLTPPGTPPVPRDLGGGGAMGRTPHPCPYCRGQLGTAPRRGGRRRAGVSPSVWRLGPCRLPVSRWHLRPHPDVWVASEPGTKPRPCPAGPSLRRKLPPRRCQASPSMAPPPPPPPPAASGDLGRGTQPPTLSWCHLSRPAAPLPPKRGAPGEPVGVWGGGGPRRSPPTSVKPETVKLIKALQQQD